MSYFEGRSNPSSIYSAQHGTCLSIRQATRCHVVVDYAMDGWEYDGGGGLGN